MADTSKRSKGSHFASNAPASGAHAAQGAKRSGARFKTAGAAPAAKQSPSATGMVSAAQPRSAAQRSAAARGGHSNKGVIAGVLIGLVIVVALGVFLVPRLFASSSNPSQDSLTNQGQEVEIVVEEGSGAYAVAATLDEAGLIASQDDFVAEMVKQGADVSLKSGAYVFTVGESYADIVTQLVEGPNSTSGTITVPEGSTLEAIADIVSGTLTSISSEDFIAQAKASNYVSEYSFLEGVDTSTYDTLEGFLYPKTYDFSGQSGVTADTVIRAMLDQFQTEITQLDFSYAESQGLNVAQVVNLASIVEKESTQSTGAMVAAVFWNRLDNMGDPNYGYLQSDATTAYTVKHDPTADEVHDENDPYSTYTHQGLPPTPICSPGLTALQSVCSPDMEYINGGYYYFYFYNDADGNIQYAFSKTLDEHNAAIAANGN